MKLLTLDEVGSLLHSSLDAAFTLTFGGEVILCEKHNIRYNPHSPNSKNQCPACKLDLPRTEKTPSTRQVKSPPNW